MDLSAYVLLSHEQALRRKLDVVANNMANVSTVGFKREQPVFHDMVERSEGDVAGATKSVAYVLDYGTVHDTAAGAFGATGNALDVMVEGDGYLGVTLPDGNTAYTRAGNLKLLDNGQLATAAGAAIQGDGGAPIVVPTAAANQVHIAADGTVNGPDGPLGRIAVTRFADEAQVDPRGDGLFDGAGGRVLSAAETNLKSGGLEASNVQPITETTQMIDILRAYQSSQKMIESLSDMRRQAIGRLGKLGN
jgi:flagellar basal-body rod protein FlgF